MVQFNKAFTAKSFLAVFFFSVMAFSESLQPISIHDFSGQQVRFPIDFRLELNQLKSLEPKSAINPNGSELTYSKVVKTGDMVCIFQQKAFYSQKKYLQTVLNEQKKPRSEVLNISKQKNWQITGATKKQDTYWLHFTSGESLMTARCRNNAGVDPTVNTDLNAVAIYNALMLSGVSLKTSAGQDFRPYKRTIEQDNSPSPNRIPASTTWGKLVR